MIALMRALRAELLKNRRTLALQLAILAPLLVAGLQFVVCVQGEKVMSWSDDSGWRTLTHSTMALWNLLMLPSFVALETALLAGLEHGNKSWKHLFALPVPRGTVYASKQIVALGLLGLSALVLWGGVLLTGIGLEWLVPEAPLEGPIPAWATLKYALSGYLASWLIIAIHTWIGTRWPSFVVAMAAGIAVTLAGIVIVNSEYGSFFPWTLPGVVSGSFIGISSPTPLVTELVAGAAGGILVALLAGWQYVRRDVL